MAGSVVSQGETSPLLALVALHCKAGEIAWRQTWFHTTDGEPVEGKIRYRANESSSANWRSPVTMPRKHSRWSGRVERVEFRLVNSITEAEAVAAGVELVAEAKSDGFKTGSLYGVHGADADWRDARDAYRQLWESINGPNSWEDWCWFVWVQPTKGSCDP